MGCADALPRGAIPNQTRSPAKVVKAITNREPVSIAHSQEFYVERYGHFAQAV